MVVTVPIQLNIAPASGGVLCISGSQSQFGFRLLLRKLENTQFGPHSLFDPLSGEQQSLQSESSASVSQIVLDPECQATTGQDGDGRLSCTIRESVLLPLIHGIYGNDCSEISFAPFVDGTLAAARPLCAALLLLRDRLAKVSVSEEGYYQIIEEMLAFQFLSSWPHQAFRNSREATLSPLLRSARDYIEDNLARHITVAEIAEASGVSVRTLQMTFKRGLQKTPVQHLIERRLERVRHELLNGENRGYIAQIAYKWGFSHIADFVKRYKVRYGETPQQTRARARQ